MRGRPGQAAWQTARDEMRRSVHTVAAENVSATLTVAVPAIGWLPGTEKYDGHLESLHHLAELAAPTSRAWTPGG